MEVKDFEEALARLETIVQELEKGELVLETALQLFEEGMKISRFCGAKLDEAERRVEILVRDESGKLGEQPFHPQQDALSTSQNEESVD